MSVNELKIYPPYQRQFLARTLKLITSKIENGDGLPMYCDIKRTEPKKGKEVIHITLEMDHGAVEQEDVKTHQLFLPPPEQITRLLDGIRNRPDQYVDVWSRWFDHLQYLKEAIEIREIE